MQTDYSTLGGVAIFWVLGSLFAAGFMSDTRQGFWYTFFMSILFSPPVGLIAASASGFKKDADDMDSMRKTIEEIRSIIDKLDAVKK